MTEQILLTTGDKITAVIDKPFFVSQGRVNSALEAMGFAEISWTEGPDSNDTLHGVYQGPTKSYDKPSQIVSYNIEHAASNVPATPATTGPVAPQAPVVVPAAPEVLPPADPKEAMAKAAKELLQGPGIGYALLLDMGFVLLMRHFWKGRKKADHGR